MKGVIEVVSSSGAKLIGVAALIDRSGQESPFGKIRLVSLAKINISTYPPQDCPLCKEGLALVKPSSRK